MAQIGLLGVACFIYLGKRHVLARKRLETSCGWLTLGCGSPSILLRLFLSLWIISKEELITRTEDI
jgi:hypothetical protein